MILNTWNYCDRSQVDCVRCDVNQTLGYLVEWSDPFVADRYSQAETCPCTFWTDDFDVG